MLLLTRESDKRDEKLNTYYVADIGSSISHTTRLEMTAQSCKHIVAGIKDGNAYLLV